MSVSFAKLRNVCTFALSLFVICRRYSFGRVFQEIIISNILYYEETFIIFDYSSGGICVVHVGAGISRR